MDRPKKPAALATTPGLPPQATVNISHGNSRVSAILPTGESVEVLLYGATVISWKDAAGNEKLWLSEAAKLDGSKAVRGGVPLVFPVFGQSPDHTATAKLPQHGFARTSRWEFLGKSTSESDTAGGDGGVKLDFGLSPSNLSEDSRAAWPHAFGLVYSITLGREGLRTSIVIRNEGESAWEFQTLMHTYFRVKDISKVTITGIESSKYTDKVVPRAEPYYSPASALSVSEKVDRVYTPAGGSSAPIVISESGKTKFSVVRDNMEQVVVWNPFKDDAQNMGDFEPKDGYKEMICVEAGAVAGWLTLEAGDAWEGGQVITA